MSSASPVTFAESSCSPSPGTSPSGRRRRPSRNGARRCGRRACRRGRPSGHPVEVARASGDGVADLLVTGRAVNLDPARGLRAGDLRKLDVRGVRSAAPEDHIRGAGVEVVVAGVHGTDHGIGTTVARFTSRPLSTAQPVSTPSPVSRRGCACRARPRRFQAIASDRRRGHRRAGRRSRRRAGPGVVLFSLFGRADDRVGDPVAIQVPVTGHRLAEPRRATPAPSIRMPLGGLGGRRSSTSRRQVRRSPFMTVEDVRRSRTGLRLLFSGHPALRRERRRSRHRCGSPVWATTSAGDVIGSRAVDLASRARPAR